MSAGVTVSAGVASTRAGAPESFSGRLLRQADAQLYLAKARGRHQACGVDLDSPTLLTARP
jgi:PleD family two-component response regulator